MGDTSQHEHENHDHTVQPEEVARAFNSDRVLATTLRSIGDGVIATDGEALVTFMNPMAEQLTGWARAEATGRPVQEVFPIFNERTRHRAANPVERVLREGIVVGLANHTVLVARDGVEHPIDDCGAPIKDDAGQVLGAVLVFRDVTEQRGAENQRQWLAAIVESSDDGIVGKNLNGIVTSWNAAAERIYGYTAAEMIGQSKSKVIPADLPDELSTILSHIKAGERIEHYETARIRKDGRRITLSISVSPIRDPYGEVIGAATIARDITEQKAHEEELQRLLEQLTEQARLLDMAHVIICDPESRITYWNSGAERLYGFTKEEAVGRTSHDLLQTRFPVSAQATDEALREHGEWSGELVHTRRDGTKVVVASHQVLHRSAAGVPLAILEVNNDITEAKRAERRIVSLNAQLQRAMLETHHRVKNNLQLITAMVDMTLMEGREAVPASEVARINDHVRLLAAVHDVLTELERDRQGTASVPARVVLNRLVPLLRAAATQHTIEYEAHADAQLSMRQATAIAIVTNELVANALKHGRSRVEIDFDCQDGRCTLTVTDNGPGFPAGFDPERDANVGLELVLMLCRWDVGGEVRFDSAPDGGGRVTLVFPAQLSG